MNRLRYAQRIDDNWVYFHRVKIYARVARLTMDLPCCYNHGSIEDTFCILPIGHGSADIPHIYGDRVQAANGIHERITQVTNRHPMEINHDEMEEAR